MREVRSLRDYIRNLKKDDELKHKQLYTSILNHKKETAIKPIRYSVMQKPKQIYYTPQHSFKQKWADYIEDYAVSWHEDYYEKIRKKNSQRLEKLSSIEKTNNYYDYM